MPDCGTPLQGRTAIVTGATGGIGTAIALDFGRQGANVVLLYKSNKAHADDVLERLKQGPGQALALCADVRNSEELRLAFDEVVRCLHTVDILVNCAGIIRRGPFLTLSEEDWGETLATNLTGYFLAGQAAARIMAGQRKGAIVNVSSTNEFIASKGDTAYAVSKGGVRLLTRQMALELAEYGIRVNAVAPTMVETPLNRDALRNEEFRSAALRRIPLGRFGLAEEVAEAVSFLASDSASFVTGATLSVDGGKVIS